MAHTIGKRTNCTTLRTFRGIGHCLAPSTLRRYRNPVLAFPSAPALEELGYLRAGHRRNSKTFRGLCLPLHPPRIAYSPDHPYIELKGPDTRPRGYSNLDS